MSAEPTFAAAQLPVVAASRTAEIREQARVAGHAAGWAAGARAAAEAAEAAARRVAERAAAAEADAHERLADALRTLGAAAGAAAARETGVVSDQAAALVTLALDLAEAIVGVELADGERSARAALARALALPVPAATVTVRLNPDDHARLRDLLADGTLTVPDGVTLADDPALEPGDAVSELPDGHLDARLGAAAARLRTVLEEAVAERDGLEDLLAASGALRAGDGR